MNSERANYFVGLDVGTTAVRCVVGELSGDSSLPKVIGFAQSPNDGMRKGGIAQADEVVQAITAATTEAQRMSGQDISAVTVNINGSHIDSISSRGVIAISSPSHEITDDDRLRVEEAAAIVQMPPNKSIIQVFAKSYRLDGQDNIKNPVGMHGVRLEVDSQIIMVSTPAQRILDQTLENAEIFASHHAVTGLAAAETVLTRKQKESGVLVLDIGAATTNLAVIEDGEIEHVAAIPMGGTHITNDLAIGLKTDLDIAEIVKTKHASLNEKQARGQVGLVSGGEKYQFDRELIKEVVSARVEELMEFVDKELKKVHRSRKLPGGVVLVGGTAKLPGIVDLTKEALGLPARLGSWGHIEKVVDGMDQLVFAPAVGLMLLDMYLGPSQNVFHQQSSRSISKVFIEPLSSFIKQFKNHSK